MNEDEICQLFSYDPTIPEALRWRRDPARGPKTAGKIAGRMMPVRTGAKIKRRYVLVTIGRKRRRMSIPNLVWRICRNESAPAEIGFADRDPENCRIENLIAFPRRPSREAMLQRQSKQNKKHREKRKAEIGEEAFRQWQQDRNMRNSLMYNYGVTEEQWTEANKRQGGVCVICQQPETLVRRGRADVLATDHRRGTKGRIRGLLCHQCNNGLGRFKDSPELLRKAAAYLEADIAAFPEDYALPAVAE